MPPKRRARVTNFKIFLAQIQRDCEYRAQGLLARARATEAQVRAVWPGGADNADTSARGWVVCLTRLAMLAGAAKDKQTADSGKLAEQRQALLDAMADTPEVVELVARDAEGAHKTVLVYPKGNVALNEVHQRNRVLARLIDDAEVICASQDPADVEIYFRAQDEMLYLQRLLCWIATTPGARLPYPERTARPALPPELDDLTALDYGRINEKFVYVNVLRLVALHDSQSPGTAPDWSVFFATLAADLDVPASTLMRDQPLASVLATAAERARGQEEGRKRAEAERQGPSSSRSAMPMASSTARGAA